MKVEWQKKRLGEIADVQSGGTPLVSNKTYWNGDLPWYSSGELNDLYTSVPERNISKAGLDNSNAKMFPAGSLLIGMYDTAALKMSILDRAGAFNQAIAGVRPNEKIDLIFVLHAINAIRDTVLGQRRGVRQKNLSLEKIRAVELNLPSLPEQQRIVRILDEAFDGIAAAKANAEKNLQNARELFESHLQSVFISRDDGHVVKPLGKLCTFSSGGTPSKANSGYWNGNIPWISGRDMKSTQLSDSTLHISRKAVDESSTRMAPKGALLILVRGMGLAHGAQIAELTVPCAFNQDIRAILPHAGLVSRYLLFALRTSINYGEGILSNAAHGTLKIDMDELANISIPVLSPEQQQKIAAQIDSLTAETQRLESIYQQKLAALDELKKSLLHRAFSGEL